MKKLFTKTFLGVLAAGISTVAFAQEAAEAAAPVEGGVHQALKTKFIEGSADFMSFVAIALILGLAFVLERIIYLNLADVNPNGMLNEIEAALDRGDVDGAKAIARDTRGPIASIAYRCCREVYCRLWWCAEWTVGKESVLDYPVYRDGTVIGLLGNSSRYDHGVR